jgi:hypothetical protein
MTLRFLLRHPKTTDRGLQIFPLRRHLTGQTTLLAGG